MQPNDLSVKFSDGMLNVRVAALIMRGDRVLVELGKGCEHYCLPGGRVQFGESAEHALVREIKEELNVDAEIVRCLYVHQCFFPMDGALCHELAFYFLATATNIPDAPFKSFDGESVFSWMKKDKLKDVAFFPLCIKNNIDNLPKHTQLVAIKEE